MSDFIVAKRELAEEEDVVMLTPVYYILDVPDDVDVPEMKMYLEKSGEADALGWNWKEYRVIGEDNWHDSNWSKNPRKWLDAAQEFRDPETRYGPWADGATYEFLANSIYDERRITLRLPVGLHVALSYAAKETSITLNSYCIRKLAEAVNYSDDLDEFEAQRRKPGRPRKVEAAKDKG